jgi:nucleotidyltransferase substrate binding protein (TIGR01987 family)
MSSLRLKQQIENFEKALASLHGALKENETEFVRDSIIQRFEFTFEMGWKCVFRWLRDQGESVPEMVRPVIQAAFTAGLIADADLWEQTKDFRDETSHTYNQSKAIEVAAFVRAKGVVAFDELAARLQPYK